MPARVQGSDPGLPGFDPLDPHNSNPHINEAHMADKQDVKKNEEQTLMTLEQLSQTLEVMTHVVDRLKTHLTRQMSLNAELFQDEEKVRKAEAEQRAEAAKKLQQESFVVEITQREMEEGTKGKKVVH
jgi:hypothetical protein